MTYPAKTEVKTSASCTSHGRMNCKQCTTGVRPRSFSLQQAMAPPTPLRPVRAEGTPEEPRIPSTPPPAEPVATEAIGDEVLRLLDLPGGPGRVLRAVHAKPGIRASALPDAAEIPKTSIAAAVSALTGRGFLRIELKPRAGPPAKGRGNLERAYTLDAQALRAALLDIAGQVRDAITTLPPP